jgi:hypothetical protein
MDVRSDCPRFGLGRDIGDLMVAESFFEEDLMRGRARQAVRHLFGITVGVRPVPEQLHDVKGKQLHSAVRIGLVESALER